MTTAILTMPRLGETMEEATVSDWLIAEGSAFERGEALIEFETDKTAVEFPALGAGRLTKQLVAKGNLIKLGEPLAEIDLMGEEDWVSDQNDGGPSNSNREKPERETIVVDLTMPRLGEIMEEGRIISWMITPGETYQRGDSLFEIETDRTAVELPALLSGRLVKTLVDPGQTVKVDTPIARIEIERDAWAEADILEPPVRFSPSVKTLNKNSQQSHEQMSKQVTPGDVIRATPLARRAARRAGLEIKTLTGTGRRGRIELVDVEHALSGQSAQGLASISWGLVSGHAVLLIHGFAGDMSTFAQLGKGLSRRGFAARAIDLPAHGKTGQEASTFDALTEGLCAELNPQKPVHIVGHSLGAAVAVAAVSKVDGAASLTLLAPAGLGLKIDAEFISGMAHAHSPGAVAHFLRRLSDRADTFSGQMIKDIYADLARHRLTALSEDICKDGRQTISIRNDLMHLARKIPIQILVGMEDRIVRWQDTLDVSPAIALHIFPRAGHMPHWDAPAETAAIIEKRIGSF